MLAIPVFRARIALVLDWCSKIVSLPLEPQLYPTVQALKEFDIRMVGVSHYTGQNPATLPATAFGAKFAFGR